MASKKLLLFNLDGVLIDSKSNVKYRGKPAPDHILIAMAEAGADPQDTTYIGDISVYFEALIRAKVDYIHAECGYQNTPFGQVIKIKSITELIEKMDII